MRTSHRPNGALLGKVPAKTLVLPHANSRAVRGLESSAALPERLAVATAASRRADFGGARTVPRTSVTERPLRR